MIKTRESVAWLREGLSGSLLLCGISIAIAFDAIVPVLDDASVSSSWVDADDVCVLLGMALIACAPSKAAQLMRSARYLVASCLLGTLGVCLRVLSISASAVLPESVFFLITLAAALLTGLFWCTAEFRFLSAMVGQGIVKVVVVMTVSHFAASTLSSITAAISTLEVSALVAALLPLVCAPFLFKTAQRSDDAVWHSGWKGREDAASVCSQDAGTQDGLPSKGQGALHDSGVDEYDQASKTRFPVRPLLLMVLVVFSVFFIRGRVPVDEVASSYMGSLAAAVLVAGIMLLSGKTVKLRFLYDTSLLFVLVGLLLFTTGSVVAHIVAASFANAGYVLLDIFVTALLCSVCATYRVNPYWLFSILELGTHLGSMIAEVASRELAGFGWETLSFAAFALAIVVTCAHTVLLTEDDYRTSWGTTRTDQKPSVSKFYWSLPDSCTFAAQRFGLTRREEDVLMLLAQRKTDAEIAGELFVSVSTVKSHCKSIYRKLGIHKRNEVLRMLGYPFSDDDEAQGD